MRMFKNAQAGIGGPRLWLLALTVCLVHCGSGKTSSGDSTVSTTESSSGSGSITFQPDLGGTSGAPLRDLGDPGEDAGCIVEVWHWLHDQDGWNGSEGGLALAGSRVHAVGGFGGGARVTLAVTGDGGLAWGLAPLEHADPQAFFESGVVGLASGDALTITSGAGGAWIERWSATGHSAGATAIPGDGYRLGPAALTPGGGIVAGGFVGPSVIDGEAVLVSLSEGGLVAWDIRLEHSVVSAVTVDPAGTIFVLAVDRFIEGGTVYLEALEPSGLDKWSVEAGSNGGFAMMGALTPFALTPDGLGGAYTLGHEHRLKKMGMPATNATLLARYDATGALTWGVAPGVPDVIEGGAVAAVGDEAVFSAASAWASTTLMVHRSDGTLVCARPVPDRSVSAAVTSGRDEVIVMGRDELGDGPAWLAKYRVVWNSAVSRN